MQIKGKKMWSGYYILKLVKSQRKCNCLKVVLMPTSRQSKHRSEEQSKYVEFSLSIINNLKNSQK